MPRDVHEHITELHAELKHFFDRNNKRQDAMQRQLDAIDIANAPRHASGVASRRLEDILREDDSFCRLARDRKGRAILNLSGDDARLLLERKTTITSAAVGASTSGVLQIERIPGITPEARQQLFLRDVLTARPTTMQLCDFVKVNAPMTIGSPQTEGNAKAENTLTFTPVSEKVRTIATWIPASRQVLDDFAELAGFIESSLTYYVNLEEELLMLSGDGTGENLHGLIPQASSFNTALLSPSAGWTRIDIVGRAIQQLATAKELQPTFIVMTPADWWSIRLTKNSQGVYLLGDPQADVAPRLFTLTVVPSVNIASGTFLLGSGNPAAVEIRDRMEMQVEVSTDHADFFTKNLIAIRGEKRTALVTKRPASFITGSFTTSP